MQFRRFSFIALLFVFLVSCNKGEEIKELKDYVSSFINSNESIVAFGNADLKTILNKTGYERVDQFKALISDEMTKIDKVLNVDEPVFFAVQGPLSDDVAPESTYLFIKVKDKKSLIAELTRRGYDVNETKEFSYTEDGDFALGIRENLALVMIKGGNYDAKKELKKLFEWTQNESSGEAVNNILSERGDFVLGMDVEALYKTSNTDLSKLSTEKQKDLKQMVANSYVQTVFKFENGAAIVETKNFFSKELQDVLFLKEDREGKILTKLGTGEPRMGFALNLDVQKIQKFLDEYSPETMREIGELTGGGFSLMMMTAGSNGLAALLNGEIGIVAFGDPSEYYFNAYVGFGPKGENLGNMAKDFLSYGNAVVNNSKTGIEVYSNTKHAPQTGKKITLPKGCENFGKSGISAFINLDGVDENIFNDLQGGENLLRIVKYATFEYNVGGGRLYVKAKKGEENVLQQSMDLLMEELIGQMGGVVI